MSEENSMAILRELEAVSLPYLTQVMINGAESPIRDQLNG